MNLSFLGMDKMPTSGDVLNIMSMYAIASRSGQTENVKVVDALLVDFINYVGVCCGVDYGMYTKDL